MRVCARRGAPLAANICGRSLALRRPKVARARHLHTNHLPEDEDEEEKEEGEEDDDEEEKEDDDDDRHDWNGVESWQDASEAPSAEWSPI